MLLNKQTQKIILTDFSNQGRNADFWLNPGTGAVIGGLIGAGKGALEQDPYQEISPGDRAFRVMSNAALGAGAGGAVGLLPRLAAQNPTANKVASVIESDTGFNILPQKDKVTRVQDRIARADVRTQRIDQDRAILDKNKRLRALERQLKKEERQLKWDEARDAWEERFGESSRAIGEGFSGLKEGVGNLFNRVRGKGISNSSYNYMGVANFSNLYPPMPIDSSTLTKTLAIGAGIGSGAGALYGATKAFADNQRLNEQRQTNIDMIQDPYLQIRQREIYDSTPSKVGRIAGDVINGVGQTAASAGLGAGLGAAALTGGLLAAKGLRSPQIAPQAQQGNRFVRAFKTIATGN